ncbi:MAG TPA: phosphoglycerate mutase, partial [Betaproteobacteria bacterium]|nr:phosphoglycerate mutase [Betaproteobacteria bacterium]
ARPAGQDNAAWRRIGNEIQMLLHAHPVNAAREARGEPVLNNLWLWGGGVLPGGLHRPFQSIAADDPLAHGLALASGVPCGAVPEDAGRWLAAAGPANAALAVLTGLIDCRRQQDLSGWRAEIARLEQHWFAPLTRALQRGALRRLTLHAPGAAAIHHFTLRRRDGWKIGRRAAAID